jgi:GAF domain-containing protein
MPRKQSLSRSMNRIGGLIHSTLDFDEIMQRVIAEAAQAVGSETAGISLRQGDHWVVRYVHGLPKDVIGTQMDDRQEPHAVLAIETKKPVVIDDALTDERVNRVHMRKWGVRSVLVVPLVTEEKAVGVLFFNRHKAGRPFTASHVDFANQLASSVSLAVRNARLFESAQAELAERKCAEQALQETNERLQTQNEELQAQGKELRAQTEEVTTANEELRENEQALRRTEEALRRAHEELQAQSRELTVANEELQVQSQQLQESEQRLRMALAGGRMGRWEWDLVTDAMFWCERTYELLRLDTFMPAPGGDPPRRPAASAGGGQIPPGFVAPPCQRRRRGERTGQRPGQDAPGGDREIARIGTRCGDCGCGHADDAGR